MSPTIAPDPTSTDGPRDYGRHTRERYKSRQAAARYAARMSRSPVDWLIAKSEVRHIGRSFRTFPRSDRRTVIDVPAGTGKLTTLLSSGSDLYVGLDISKDMLGHVPAVNRSVGDVVSIPIRSGSVGVVVSLRLFHRVPRHVLEAALVEFRRVGTAGMIVSYAGHSKIRRLMPLARKVLRRKTPVILELTPEAARSLVTAHGDIVYEGSVLQGLSGERIVAVAFR